MAALEPSRMASQVYTPIDSANSEIRLLKIQPANKESDET